MPQWCDKHQQHTIDERCPGCQREREAPQKRIDELESLCKDCNKLLTEIMPQAGKLVFQDYGLLNETLIKLDEIEKDNKEPS